MKVLILSTSDIEGGAARAAYRLHQGLCATGASSTMLVRARHSADASVVAEKSILTKLGPQMNGLPLRQYPNRKTTVFSTQWFPDAIARRSRQINPEVINLHWVGNGFLRIETLAQLKKPLFWTLQDMWPFTGGCHYSDGCDRFSRSCGRCPQLGSQKERDLSYLIWRRKSKAWKNLNLTIITPSHWMAESVKASSLFKHLRVEVIPFCLDTDKFRPVDIKVARNLLNLPQDKFLILFGALSATTDRRKGYHLLLPALQRLHTTGWEDKVELVVFGASKSHTSVESGFRTHYLGTLQDDLSLAIAYSAADVMLVPSLQESFGQTASESFACATPVVAFNATGLKDIVDHKINGYLARPYEVDDLAAGIKWVLDDAVRHAKLSAQARQKAEKTFGLIHQAQSYLALFTDVLQGDASRHLCST